MGQVLGNQTPGIAAVTRAERVRAMAGRLRELAPEHDAAAPERLVAYHEMLVDWNTRMNLTRDTDFQVALDRHYADSLAPLQAGGLFRDGAELVDVGSGAGLPGIPLAIVRPDFRVTLLDSLAKRIGFLEAVARELGLVNVRAVHARAEDAAHRPLFREAFDVAVARAVAPLPVLCELLLPFVRVGGRMICYKGPAVVEEQGSRAAAALGGGPIQVIPIAVPGQPSWRHSIAVSEKKEKTVRQYPRKAGTPSRDPIGASDGG